MALTLFVIDDSRQASSILGGQPGAPRIVHGNEIIGGFTDRPWRPPLEKSVNPMADHGLSIWLKAERLLWRSGFVRRDQGRIARRYDAILVAGHR
ncbi:hypothetical protein [Aurantimonas sp. A3-2-R12]|uniref:hypothetical protein n=1 Tax=Aurantimonas sp. A3-2-R12 TaxID=3114362 RepID=UPI002E192F80|nr:hypothetical protein [Aurantimonas sp. A3-2-R12]